MGVLTNRRQDVEFWHCVACEEGREKGVVYLEREEEGDVV